MRAWLALAVCAAVMAGALFVRARHVQAARKHNPQPTTRTPHSSAPLPPPAETHPCDRTFAPGPADQEADDDDEDLSPANVPEEPIEALVTKLADPSVQVRRYATFALGSGPDEWRPTAATLLCSRLAVEAEPSVRSALIEMLGRIQAGFDRIEARLLGDSDSEVRRTAAFALQQFGDRAAPVLAQAGQRERDSIVQAAIRESLQAIRGELDVVELHRHP
jgi:hypothetical protein